jgi:hypothetical protein
MMGVELRGATLIEFDPDRPYVSLSKDGPSGPEEWLWAIVVRGRGLFSAPYALAYRSEGEDGFPTLTEAQKDFARSHGRRVGYCEYIADMSEAAPAVWEMCRQRAVTAPYYVKKAEWERFRREVSKRVYNETRSEDPRASDAPRMSAPDFNAALSALYSRQEALTEAYEAEFVRTDEDRDFIRVFELDEAAAMSDYHREKTLGLDGGKGAPEGRAELVAAHKAAAVAAFEKARACFNAK